jgi:hypothetical protein
MGTRAVPLVAYMLSCQTVILSYLVALQVLGAEILPKSCRESNDRQRVVLTLLEMSLDEHGLEPSQVEFHVLTVTLRGRARKERLC